MSRRIRSAGTGYHQGVFTLSHRGRRPGGRAALGAVLIACWLTLLTVPASAHDALEDSTPAAGELLSEVPQELALTFTGEISDLGVQFVVTGPEGRDVVQGTPTVDGVNVTQPLAEELTDGDYEAAWRVTSSDGHPISGTIEFTIAADTPGDGEQESATGPESTGASSATGTGSGTETSEGTGEETTGATTTTPEPTTSDAQGTDQAAATVAEPQAGAQTGTEGIPTWGWLVAGLAALGLIACGFLAFRRN